MEKERKKQQKKGKLCTSCIHLTKKEVDFLDKIIESCAHPGPRPKDKKLCRGKILRAFLGVLMRRKLNITVGTVESEEHLTEKLLEAFREYE